MIPSPNPNVALNQTLVGTEACHEALKHRGLQVRKQGL